jgi:hypothetical protein
MLLRYAAGSTAGSGGRGSARSGIEAEVKLLPLAGLGVRGDWMLALLREVVELAEELESRVVGRELFLPKRPMVS